MAAHILGFIFHDHIIVDMESEDYYSFSNNGQIDEMKVAAKKLF